MSTKAEKSAAKPAAKAPPKPAAAKPKASFAAASFAALRSAAGEGQGETLRILLADIDEDPDQPRTSFALDELEAMAASIRDHDVVQPITVRPAVDGRYTIVFGARRVRAARLAGKADIPAVIRVPSTKDFAAQVIENQQRSNLSNSDLAAAIAKLSADGNTNKQIGAICSLKDYQVAAFKQVESFPPELRGRLDSADMRALYDLFRQWGKTPNEVIEALPEPETYITVTEARRIIGAITGKPTGSIVLDRQTPVAAEPPATDTAPSGDGTEPESAPGDDPAGAPKQSPGAERGTAAKPKPRKTADSGDTTPDAKAPPAAAETPVAEPVFMVAGLDGQSGRLIVDRRAERAGYALVDYGASIEEVDAAALRIVAVE